MAQKKKKKESLKLILETFIFFLTEFLKFSNKFRSLKFIKLHKLIIVINKLQTLLVKFLCGITLTNHNEVVSRKNFTNSVCNLLTVMINLHNFINFINIFDLKVLKIQGEY